MNTTTSRKRKRQPQEEEKPTVVTDGSDSEEEFDFVNIDLGHATSANADAGETSVAEGLTVRLESEDQRTARLRYPTAAIARKIRLEIHKTHLLCLLSHVAIRNKWCSDNAVQEALARVKGLFKGNVHPKTTSAQIQRTRVLIQGLEALSDLWAKSFKITAKGLSKPKWYTEQDLPKIMASGIFPGHKITMTEFLHAARTLQGDRDIGAQLFVALLRSFNLDVRLVCSLQPLALHVGKGNLATVIQDSSLSESESLIEPSTASAALPQGRKLTKPKLGIPNRKPPQARPRPQVKLLAPIVEGPYPIYWAEVFDPAAQKWYSVDPLVTETVNKPARFEPPQSESENTMSYVIGFNEDRSARDVTHRYTKQYNAKVRRHRLESIPSGGPWWSKVMDVYAPKGQSDRNLIEDAEFAQRELSEGIPANVTDLKNHPLFVLSRHLRKDEIIQPLRDCGTITIGKSKPPVVEKVYPRKFVIRLRSSLNWYMRGRQVMIGEKPLKTVAKRQKRPRRLSDNNDPDPPPTMQSSLEDDDAGPTEDLYAESQTAEYIPFPIVNGKVPRNKFGTIDLFTPAFLPPGGTHRASIYSEASAKLLSIDYAAAVVGFEYGKVTLPKVKGVVVDSAFDEAMEVVEQGMAEDIQDRKRREVSMLALARWSHFLRSLRIRDHVQSRYGGVDQENNDGGEESG